MCCLMVGLICSVQTRMLCKLVYFVGVQEKDVPKRLARLEALELRLRSWCLDPTLPMSLAERRVFESLRSVGFWLLI